MDTIVMVRHGQAEHNVGGLTGGWSQTSLTGVGRRQVRSLAKRLKDELEGVNCAFYHSDLRRARQTADIITLETGLDPTPAPELREFNNGIAADRNKEEVAPYFVEPTDPLMDWQPYPEAETWRRFYRRVSEFMERLYRKEDRPTLIVAHGGTIVNICAWWLRIEEEALSYTTFNTSPASLTVLNITKLNERAIERLNDTAHLYGMALTPPILDI
ncbi:MAG: histidine phosphatase family protein [Candidatus Bathyarchaeota archaeon]|jgi:probable phosphoglycerate mutase